mgnify:FL=1
MAYPVVQGQGSLVEGLNNALLTPAWPTHQAGDIGLLIVETGQHPFELANAQGFKELPWSPQKDGSSNDSATTTLHAYWKRATGAAEPAPTLNAPVGTSFHARALILVIRGASPAGVPWDAGDGDDVGVASSAISFRDIDTVDNECLILHILTHSVDTLSAGVSGWTNPNLTDITEVLDDTSTIGGGSGIAIASGKKATSGSIGNTTATLSHTSRQARIVIAFSSAAEEEDKSPWRGKLGTPVDHASVNVSPAWPTHQAGDIGILIAHGGVAPTLAVAQGFAPVDGSPIMAGSGSSGIGLGVWWKRATSAAEAAPTVAFGTDHIRAMIFTIKGVAPAGTPINEATAEVTTVASSAVAFPSITTTTRDCLVLAILANSIDSFNDTIARAWTKGNLEGIAEWYDLNVTTVSGGGFQIPLGRKKSPGATGVLGATLNSASHQAKLVMALEGLAGETVNAEVGAFALSGKQASFLKHFHLDADVGAFALAAGGDVTFPTHQHFKLLAETGVFISSPSSATFSRRLVDWSKESAVVASWVKETPLED